MATWYDVDSIREDWDNAPLNDDVLSQILEAAKASVLAYAPALPEPETPAFSLDYDPDGTPVLVIDEQYVDTDPDGVTVLVMPGPEEIPATYRLAQRMQAENIYNSGAVNPNTGEFGDDFSRGPHPLDWMIKQILRPKKAVPRVR